MLRNMSRGVSRGMIQSEGVTYRVERSAPHCYRVVRLLDDVEVGTFQTRPSLRIKAVHIELASFRELVRAVMRTARTSAVMHAVPACPPAEETATSASRTPSTMPSRPVTA